MLKQFWPRMERCMLAWPTQSTAKFTNIQKNNLVLNSICISYAGWALFKSTKTFTHTSMLESSEGAASCEALLCIWHQMPGPSKKVCDLVEVTMAPYINALTNDFTKKVSLEVSIPKKMKPETEFMLFLLQEICHPPTALTAAALGVAVNSKSKLISFMLWATQTLGWKLTFLSIW